jgi:hypothetical protein
VVDKNKAVVCCLLATSIVMLSGKKKRKRKMWSKKWYLKGSISCDADLLNELLETYVPWDDASVVSASILRKLWVSLSELRSSVCVKDDWKGQFWDLRYCLSKLRSLLSFSRQAWSHTVKSLSLTERECIALFRGWVDPKVIVCPEGMCQWKIPVTPTGIEPAIFGLVAQFLNQPRHHVSQQIQ